VAISEFVAADIAASYGERWRPRLTVIPDPVSWARFDASGAHGELPPRRHEKRGAELPSGEWIVPTGYISDAALGALYRRATAFVFPSLFEGFSMPAVETLGFGLPVVASRTTAIPESTRGLACLLDDATDTARMGGDNHADPRGAGAMGADVADLRRAYDPSPSANSRSC
jgi:glycosyltransferase involved in cell wall biosynthesis